MHNYNNEAEKDGNSSFIHNIETRARDKNTIHPETTYFTKDVSSDFNLGNKHSNDEPTKEDVSKASTYQPISADKLIMNKRNRMLKKQQLLWVTINKCRAARKIICPHQQWFLGKK